MEIKYFLRMAGTVPIFNVAKPQKRIKPPRASLPKGWSLSVIELEKALKLLSLPREIGPHPEDGLIIEAGLGDMAFSYVTGGLTQI